MALQRHLWYTGWALITLERSDYFIIGYVMAKIPYLPNYAFPRQPHGLAEAPVVHCLGPDQLGVPRQPRQHLLCDVLPHVYEFQVYSEHISQDSGVTA